VHSARAAKRFKGRVTGQVPRAGVRRPIGTSVHIVIGRR
jgi:hypothetical protein